MKKMVCLFQLFIIINIFFSFWISPFYGKEGFAADYPSKAITSVVPYSPGGTTDLACRALADALQERLKVPIVTLNKTGGGGVIAAGFICASNPDGYTFGHFGPTATLPADISIQKINFKPEELIPVIQWSTYPLAVAVRADSPWKKISDVLSYVEKNPNEKIKYAHHGLGQATHLQMVMLSKMLNIPMAGIPFKGDPDILTAILGNSAQMGVFGYSFALPHMQGGQIHPLFLFSPIRIATSPNVPTFKEVANKDPMIEPSFLATYVPGGTPRGIVKKLHDEIKACSDDPKFKDKMKKIEMEIVYCGTEDLQKKIDKYRKETLAFFKELGLK